MSSGEHRLAAAGDSATEAQLRSDYIAAATDPAAKMRVRGAVVVVVDGWC